MKFCIVIVNYNGWAHTIECLESLFKAGFPFFRVILVDNASTDDSVAQIRSWAAGGVSAWVAPSSPHRGLVCPPVSKPIPLWVVDEQFGTLEGNPEGSWLGFILSSTNRGFGGGNNLGMAWAEGAEPKPEHYWLLNNDTVVGPGTLGALPGVKMGDRCIAGFWLMEYTNPQAIQVVGGCRFTAFAKRSVPCRSKKESSKLDYIHGACLILPASLFRETGGFDPAIFMYYEEIDLCLRARKRGFGFAVLPLEVFHKGGMSSNSMQQWLWGYQNKFHVLFHHFGFGIWAVSSTVNLLLVGFFPWSPPGKRRAALKVLWAGIRSGFRRIGTILGRKSQSTHGA